MDGKYTPGPSPALPPDPPPGPVLVVVGAASRDVTDDDPRGWRLGGGVTYSALTAARLGLRTAAVVGVDGPAADADELDLLRAAGVELRLIRLAHGPVLVNEERPEGRRQRCLEPSDPVPPDGAPRDWRTSPGWVLAPVAAELPDGWAAVPSEGAFVALGWQGLLRALTAGEPVRRVEPRAGRLLRRADLVGVSRDDLAPDQPLDGLVRLLRPGATLAVTRGDRGGILVRGPRGGPPAGPDDLDLTHYPAVAAGATIDPTGAGDVFLAALAAARIEPRLVGGRIGQGFDLLLAAAAASLVIERPGLHGVPDRAAIRRRMTAARRPAIRDDR